MASEAEIRLGTSAFTAAGWEGILPGGDETCRVPELLRHKIRYRGSGQHVLPHARDFNRKGLVCENSPGIFVCGRCRNSSRTRKRWWTATRISSLFLKAMDCLGEKLGPLLLQFGYFNKNAFAGVNEFLARLVPFLKKIPKGYRFAVEIRNKNWLVPALVEALRERHVALALVDHAWMPRPRQLFDRFDPITADFAYVRWLGDRKGIEEKTKTWNKIIVNRAADLGEWVEVLKKFTNGKFRFSRSPTIIMRVTAPARSKSLERCGGASGKLILIGDEIRNAPSIDPEERRVCGAASRRRFFISIYNKNAADAGATKPRAALNLLGVAQIFNS